MEINLEDNKMQDKELYLSMKQQRKNMVEATVKARQGHLSSGFSIVELINVLFKEVMVFDRDNPDAYGNDRFILSKGHAALALYSLFYDMGVLYEEQFFSFSQYDSILGEHPDRNKVPCVDISTGSLGHGLPCGVGMATAYKAKNENNNVYVIIGDGEANEGSIWEAALIAERLCLDNLICIVDNNHSESYSPFLVEKFHGFGWDTIELDNGNDLDEIRKALSYEHKKPLAIVANTIKGYGSKLMENDPEGWHHRVPTDEEYKQLMEELS